MKATLEFNLPEEREEHELAVKAGCLYSALFDVRQKLLRPARKHGYSDPELARLIEQHPEAAEVVGELERLFNDILDDNGVSGI